MAYNCEFEKMKWCRQVGNVTVEFSIDDELIKDIKTVCGVTPEQGIKEIVEMELWSILDEEYRNNL